MIAFRLLLIVVALIGSTAIADEPAAKSNRASLIYEPVTIKEHVLQLINERDQKYEQRLKGIDDKLEESRQAVKDAMAAANLMLETAMISSEKAILKAEASTEKRFASVNEFRAQLQDQNNTFSRAAEVNYRFEALEKKLDAAIEQLRVSHGREEGVASTWAIMIVIVTLLLSTGGIVVAIVLSRGKAAGG